MTSLTCDLDVEGGVVVAGVVLGPHGDAVDPQALVAVLDGLVRHGQVLVDGPHPVPQVHLVFSVAGVALWKKDKVIKWLTFSYSPQKQGVYLGYTF